MTRAKISQYSATAGDNTDVNGVNIAEGCPPSSMNNMGREIMAALKRFQVGSDGDGVTVGGSLVVSGATTANTLSATNVTATNVTATTLTVNSNNISADNSLGFRNRIINGDMRIDQRNAGAAVTAATAFPVDRFRIDNATDGAYSAQQDSSAPVGFVNSVKWTTTTADGTLTTTQQAAIQQRIEGTNVADLAWGTANAKTVTLSFWVRSSLTGTFGGSLRNSAGNRSYPFTYAISAADTWEQKSVTVAGDTSGTWLTTTGTGIFIFFSLGAGPDRSGTAGAWNSNNNTSATGAVSVIGTLNATWFITGVQLEVGSVATPFERRPYGTELALCQRYYYKLQASALGSNLGVGFSDATTSGVAVTQLPVTMRTSPTALEQSGTAGDYSIRQSGGVATTCNAVPTFGGAGTTNTVLSTFGVASGLTAGQGITIRAVNSSAYLGWSAEL